MQRQFSLFQSHLDLAHAYWERLLKPGDWAIDATCGNGQDTLKLAQILGKSGGVIGIDIQEEAIARSRELLHSHPTADLLAGVHLFRQSHEEFPPLSSERPIRLIVYNLGYLPRGDKGITTLTETTLQSISRGLELVMPGGAISITCYPGHSEGAREERTLLEWASQLSPSNWNICLHSFPNRSASPRLLLLQKSINAR
ncbi:MAG: methyltransferase domain-containing protein [Verrucomicrobia bacterium]|nr:methyltransferase domain-containing protein [Verrucomicrobiota bacterium]